MKSWIPAFAGVTRKKGRMPGEEIVIPAKAGIQHFYSVMKNWIPAFAGMTRKKGRMPGEEIVIPAKAGIQHFYSGMKSWIPAFAGMTRKKKAECRAEKSSSRRKPGSSTFTAS